MFMDELEQFDRAKAIDSGFARQSRQTSKIRPNRQEIALQDPLAGKRARYIEQPRPRRQCKAASPHGD